jgi:hypothetical protein
MGDGSTNEGESGGLHHSDHPGCRRVTSVPNDPQTNQAITIGGKPARLLNMQCPPGSGFLVETATTIHHGIAYVFASENPSGSAADHGADRAAFRKFLAGVRVQR